jgi:phage terminase large subunit-like protein
LADEGVNVVQFPQSASRMCPAPAGLYAAIVERRLKHPNDPDLNRHVASAIAKDSPRGWRVDKARRTAQIDAVVALTMAVERAMQPAPKVKLFGWL